MDARQRKLPAYVWPGLAIVGALALYMLSIGPVFWLMDRYNTNTDAAGIVYRPILWLWLRGPRGLGTAFQWYVDLGSGLPWAIDPDSLTPFRNPL